MTEKMNDEKRFNTYNPKDEDLPSERLAKPKLSADKVSVPDTPPGRPAGRPRSGNPKVSVTIRLDRDVVDAFKEGGARLANQSERRATEVARQLSAVLILPNWRMGSVANFS